MIIFDADVLSELFRGTGKIVARAKSIPSDQHALPIVVVEEILRGRLSMIRRAEAGRAAVRIERAYSLLQETISYIQHFQVLAYTSDAERLYQGWRDEKIRVGTHDMRIAASGVANSAKLISPNRHDFELIPDLVVEFWD